MSASEIKWQKSSFSGGGGENCVELAQHDGGILMRESDDPGAIVVTSRDNLRAFLLGVKAGEFDHLIE
ncbi:DUF397 domain-containing protein [Streptomyces mobaraensis]|uniref:DUF397 domain-containing protein n=1 Tax=Streptomyces mobaraensis TaxID=35621 RepID=A0A5N5VYW0_STRMB|nr:DUF397 domain-containing protein [Streptomyces mobaraensis]KAB7834081.1 DUF397 domain-containing protein [Streptomyces mobaraensis]